MENNYLILTPSDQAILTSCKIIVDGLAEYLGNGYEFVIHSLENLDQSVIKIINGHYSNRREGAPITDLALSMLEKIKAHGDMHSYSYYNKNKKGVVMKSTTIPITGENNRIIGLLCINFYTDISFTDLLANFTPTFSSSSENDHMIENFSDNIDELILIAVEEASNNVIKNPQISTINKNKEIIYMLNEKGIFKLKDAVIKVAYHMGISKNTVYMHLRNLSNCIE